MKRKITRDKFLDAMRRDVERHEALMKKPARERYALAQDIWEVRDACSLENWPQALHDLSMPSHRFPLTLGEARIFGTWIAELGEGFDELTHTAKESEELWTKLRDSFDAVLQGWPDGGFVRLGSRSPKDCMYWGMHPDDTPDGRVRTGESAIRRLTGCSERMYDDLQMALAMNVAPSIWLRKWIDIDPSLEFRCFMRNRQLIGVSQYQYREVYGLREDEWRDILWEISDFFRDDFLSACPMGDVIFDVALTRWALHRHGFRRPLLIEINPYLSIADPCLFQWHDQEAFKAQLRYVKDFEKGLVSTPIIGEVFL